MKFSFNLCFIVMTFFDVPVHAQKITIQWGPEFQESKWSSIYQIYGRNDENLYAFRYEKLEPHIDSYNIHTLDRVYSKPLKFPESYNKDLLKNLTRKEMFKLKDRILMYWTKIDHKQDIHSAYFNTVDLKTGVVNQDLKLIDEIKNINRRSFGGFKYVISNDSAKFLFYHDEPYSKDEPQRYAAQLMGPDLEKIWSKNFQVNEPERWFEISAFEIDRDGTYYQLVKNVAVQKTAREVPDYKWQIISYRNESNETKIYDLALTNKLIKDIRFEIDSNGDIVCAGFYSIPNTDSKDKSNIEVLKGSFYMKFDKTSHELLLNRTFEFDKKLIDEFIKDEHDESEGISNLEIKDFIFEEERGMVMLAEQFFNRQKCYTSNEGRRYCDDHLYYNSILVINYDTLGNIKWSRSIPKLQYTINDRGSYSSFFNIISSDKLFFVFNDDPKNFENPQPKKRVVMKSPKKSIAVLAEIDMNGKLTISELFNNRDLETICRPGFSFQDSENGAFIYAERKGTYRFGRISLQ